MCIVIVVLHKKGASIQENVVILSHNSRVHYDEETYMCPLGTVGCGPYRPISVVLLHYKRLDRLCASGGGVGESEL